MPIADAPDFVVFEGDDAATLFPFEFLVRTAADVEVYIQNLALFTETLVDGDDYEVVIDGENGGTVEYPLVGDPLSDDYNLVIKRAPTFETSLNLTSSSGFQPIAATRQLDNIEMQIQQLRTDAQRALKVVHGEVGGLFDADVSQINQAAANAAAAAASALAADASADAADESEAEAEAAAETALGAAAAAVSGTNMAALLLGTGNGIAVDFVSNDFFNRGGTLGTVSTTAFGTDAMDFARPLTAARGVDADGFLSSFAADVPILPSRRPLDGENRGIFISKHLQSLVLYPDDISTAGGWALASLTAEIAAGEIAPDGTETVWRLTDTSTTVYGKLTLLFNDIVEDLEWLTWFIFVKVDPESPEEAAICSFKSTMTGGGVPAVTFNTKWDVQSGQIAATLAGNDPFVVEYPNGWKLIGGSVQNTEQGHTNANWIFYPNFADASSLGSLLAWGPGFIKGKLFTGWRTLADAPTKPTLTGAKWNTLAGDTTIGTFGAGNLANLALSHADWVASNVTKTTNAGAGVGGADAYTLDDTSGAANAFVQQTHLASAVSGAEEWANISWFIHTASSTGRRIDIRSNFYGGTPVQPVFTFDYDSKTVEISGGNGTAEADVVPVDANTVLLVAWFQNSADAANVNFRNNIYPSGPEIEDEFEIRVSRPFLKITADPLWTPDALTLLSPDHITRTLTDTDWNGSAFGVRVDMDDMQSPELGSSDAHHIWSVDDGTADNRWSMTFQRTDDDPVTHSLIVRSVAGGVEQAELLYEGAELNAAQLEFTVGGGEAILARDDAELYRTEVLGTLPTGLNTLHVGESAVGTGQPSANALRAALWTQKKSVQFMFNAGKFDFNAAGSTSGFSTATKAALRAEAYAARTALMARQRTGLPDWDDRAYWLATGEGQSFIRGAWANTSLLTTVSWLAINAAMWGDSLMYEGSVRTSASGGTIYTPITDYAGVAGRGPGLNQLAATADAGNDSLTEVELEANFADPTPNTAPAGENPITAFVHGFKQAMNLEKGRTSDSAHRLIAATIGTSSDSTIAALAGTDPAQHGADSNPWLRHESYLEIVRDHLINDLFVDPSQIGQLLAKLNHGESMTGTPVADLLDGNVGTAGIGMREWCNNIQLRAQSVFGQTSNVLIASTIPGRLRWGDDLLAEAEANLTLEAERQDFFISGCSLAMQSGGSGLEQVDGVATPGDYPSSGDHQTSVASIVDGLHAKEGAVEILSGRNWFIPRKHKAYWSGKYIYLTVISMNNPVEPRKSFITYGLQPEEIYQDGFTVKVGSNKFRLAADPIYESDPLQPGVTGILLELESTPSSRPDLLLAAKTDSEGASAVYEEDGTFPAPWTYRHNSYDYPSREIVAPDEGWEVGELLPRRRPLIPFRVTCEEYVPEV